ncbi:large ribosomal subunit protein mL37-like [Lineus longissimus]|uniref:large ribosomal subunit protein mL37-like n=1 Tax=Lineus longissimus TaxID=88925 RepID=UPI002B4CA2F4
MRLTQYLQVAKKAKKFVWEAKNVYRRSPLRWKNANLGTRFKQLWKHQISIYKEPPSFQPHFLDEQGIEVVNPLARTPNEKWEQSVPDDPRFIEIEPSDHPDWHDEPLLCVNKRVRLVEGEKQACILTKTQPFDGLPPSVQELVGKEEIPYQDDLMQRAILQAHCWDTTQEKLPKRYNKQIPGWKYKAEWGIPQEKIVHILYSNILRLCSSVSTRYPEILTTRRLNEDAYVNTNYQHNGTPIMIKGSHQYLITSDRPLAPFADETMVDDSVQHTMPDLFPLFPTIDLHKTNLYTMENNTGWQMPYSHNIPHTLFVSNGTKLWNPDQLNANSMMFLFGHLIAHAKAKYGADATTLPEPISGQCVHTNGIDFHLIFYQLNTLDFSSTEGIKNFVWFDRSNRLFEKRVPKRAMLRNTKYEDYDPVVFKKLLAVYLNGIPRHS